MANYSNLKTAIENAVDWNNGDNEITGQNLLDILETIIDSLGAKYKFANVATPSSSITTPDEPLFYLAGAGTYTNFSGLSVTIPRGTLAIFYYDTAWHYTTVRTDSDAFFNVNQHLGTPSTTYTKANGRNAVPSDLRTKGMIITYLTTNGWIIEQNLSTSGTWNADANWQTIGPVSVSQITETGKTALFIGNNPELIVDDEPTPESDNLVKSGGVEKSIRQSASLTGYVSVMDKLISNHALNSTGQYVGFGFQNATEVFFSCNEGDKILINSKTRIGNPCDTICFYSSDDESTFISGIEGNDTLTARIITVPTGAKFFRFSTSDIANSYILYGINEIINNILNNLKYYICSTASGVGVKVIDVPSYYTISGGSFKIKFNNKNTANNVSLKIGSETEYPLYYNNSVVSSDNSWDANEIVEVFFDGEHYQTYSLYYPVTVNETDGGYDIKIGDKTFNVANNAELSLYRSKTWNDVPLNGTSAVDVISSNGTINIFHSSSVANRYKVNVGDKLRVTCNCSNTDGGYYLIYLAANADQNTPANLIKKFTAGEIAEEFTADIDGFLFVQTAVQGTSYTVTDISVKREELSNQFIDFQEEIDDLRSVQSSMDKVLMYTPKIVNRQPNFDRNEFRVLMIGNSYDSDYNKLLSAMCSAAGIDTSDICVYYFMRSAGTFKMWYDIYNNSADSYYNLYKRLGSLYAVDENGQNIDEQFVDATIQKNGNDGSLLRTMLQKNRWDLITIHQDTTLAAEYDWEGADAKGYLNQFVRIIRTCCPNACVGTIINHSSYSGSVAEGQTTKERFNLIANAVKMFHKDYGINMVIPCGTAVENIRESALNTSTHQLCSDGHHLAHGIAQYAADAALFESIIAPRYGKTILGNSLRVSISDTDPGYGDDAISVTDDNAQTVQMAAILAVNDLYKVQNPDGVVL